MCDIWNLTQVVALNPFYSLKLLCSEVFFLWFLQDYDGHVEDNVTFIFAIIAE